MSPHQVFLSRREDAAGSLALSHAHKQCVVRVGPLVLSGRAYSDRETTTAYTSTIRRAVSLTPDNTRCTSHHQFTASSRGIKAQIMASDEHSWDRACTHSRGCWGEGGGEWRSRARSIQQHQRVAAPLAQLQQQVAAQPLVACFVASHVISKVRTKALSRLLASIDEQELEGALPVHLSWHAPEPGARRQVEAITAGRPWMRRCLEQHSPHSQFEHLEALVKDALNGPVPPPYWSSSACVPLPPPQYSHAILLSQWPTAPRFPCATLVPVLVHP